MKKFLFLFFIFLLPLATRADDSGTCGENLIWTFDSSTRTLTISGNGYMEDYFWDDNLDPPIPWVNYDIEKIIVEEGVSSIGDHAFFNCSGLTSITIPKSVIWIGIAAFSNCSSLTSIDIPKSVIWIGIAAFSNCSSLSSVTIPNSVMYIGSGAFNGCTGLPIENNIRYADTYLIGVIDETLSSYQIKEGTRFIGSSAFSGCSGLTSITIPNSVTSIGDWAFHSCSSLASFTIPSSVTSIGNYVFQGCSGLTSVTIPNNVTSIGNYAFDNCSGLTSVTIPNSVTSIGNSAFSGCSDLTSIDIPNSVTSIGDYAFEGCTRLTSITIPSSVMYIGSGAFNGCTGFPIENNIRYADTYLIGVIDETLSSYQIKEGTRFIGSSAFSGCSSLTSIDIPNSVTSIGYRAFYGCSGLASVKMDNPTPIKIYESSFPDRRNTTLLVPVGSRDAYLTAKYWKDFKEIIEYSDIIEFADPLVKSICVTNWDTNKDGELEMSEAAAVTSLGTVFKKKNITSFNELRYFTGLKTISEGAFASCNKIQEVTLPVNVESLEKDAFLYCKSLVSLHIPAKVASMGLNALSGCTAMTSITVDEDNDTYCSIEGVLFTKDKKQLLQFPCAKTSEYTIPEGTEVIGRDAFYQAMVTSVMLPSTLKELVYDAFGDCKQLAELEMPEGLETIGDHIFNGCSALKTIHIPSTVTSIGQYMCTKCNSITDVYSEIKDPSTINDNNFTDGVYGNATLHVPAGTKNKYASVGGWKNFAFIDAGPEPYLALSQDGKSVTFYYDNQKEDRPGMVFDLDGYMGLGADTATVVTKVVFDPSFAEARPANTRQWFYRMDKLSTIEGMEYLNTSEVTTMQAMFSQCSSLESLDLSHFDTSKVTSTRNMFNGCSSLTSLDVGSFNTSNVTTMYGMFYNCSGLASLDLSHFDTSNVTTMQSMFNGCSSLASLDLSNFDTSNVTTMAGMFNGCAKLASVDVSSFNTSEVTTMEYMFVRCSSLTSLDVSSFDMSNVTSTTSMFGSCNGLTHLSISGTMGNLAAKACNGVGTEESPCIISAPEGFDFGVATSGAFQWKGGWFTLEDTGYSSCTLAAKAVSIAPGGGSALVLSLDNGDEKVSAFQFDLTLPEGVTLAEDGNGFACTLADRCKGMSVRVVEKQDRCYSLMAFFLDYNKTIEGTSGPVVTLALQAEEGLSEGDLEGVVDNIVLTNLDYDVLKVAPVTFPITISQYPSGDVNHDGDVNVADVMMTVGYILGKPVNGFHVENGDVNHDGSVNISDVMGIVDIVLFHVSSSAPALATTDGIAAVSVPGGVDLHLDNASRYTALEMTVELPYGATLTRASLCKSGTHQVMSHALGGGLHRVVVYSLSGEPLPEGDALLHLDIAGSGAVKVSDVLLANPFYEGLAPQEATSIINLDSEANDTPLYNLQGMKVKQPRKGVYVQDGKKMLVK